MGTIAEKLSYLADTKDLFKDRLNSLGAEIIESTTFRNYLNWLDEFYGEVSDKTDLSVNGVVGRTSQETTTGKNLCYFSNFTEGRVNFNGSEINVGNTTGSVVYVGSNFNLQDDTSKSGKTYTIYACVNGTKQAGSVGTGLSINFAKTGVPIAFQVGLASSEGSFNNRIYVGTITLGENEVFRNVSVFTNNAITANINVKVMIVEGSYTAQTIGDYEPYTGGIASPNPDYPQEINNLSGDVEYKVRGKNLFDKDNANILKGWFRDVTDEMVLNSVSTDRIIAFEGKPNTTYTISKKLSNRFRVDLYNSLLSQDGTYTFNYPIIKNDSGTNITVTTTATDYYIYIHVYQSSDGDFQAILNSIQIEYGNSASSYEPYISESFPLSLGDIELCNISDYKDRIYSQNGEFYLEKKNGKVVLDGSESWVRYGAYGTPTYYLYYVDNLLNGLHDNTNRFGYGYASYFKWVYGINAENVNYSYIRLQYSNGKRVYIGFPDDLSLANFKSWLSTHNTVVYYVLATPTTTEITQENYPTLYSQLQAIQEFLTKYKINKEFLLDYSSPEIEY